MLLPSLEPAATDLRGSRLIHSVPHAGQLISVMAEKSKIMLRTAQSVDTGASSERRLNIYTHQLGKTCLRLFVIPVREEFIKTKQRDFISSSKH